MKSKPVNQSEENEDQKATEVFLMRLTKSEKESFFSAAGGKRKTSAWAKNILLKFTAAR